MSSPVFKIQIKSLTRTSKFYQVSLLPSKCGLYVVFPFHLDADPQFIKETIINHVKNADIYIGKKKIKNATRD